METNQPTPEQAAKKAWEKKSDIYGVPDHPYSEGFMDGIDLYQASLKKMVEARIVELKEMLPKIYSQPGRAAFNYMIIECERFLEMITTAMPPSK